MARKWLDRLFLTQSKSRRDDGRYIHRWKPSTRRRLLILAGFHKTGTTALQTLLSSSRSLLRSANLLYPITGCPQEAPLGHHNIAWQLAGDRRFESSAGTLDDIASEISSFGGDAIVSSEDFETIFGRPDSFLPLLRHVALRNHDFTILISARDQVTYFESLFFQMIDYGLAEDLGNVCRAAVAGGTMSFEDWTFHFDYRFVERSLSRLPANVIILPYRKSSISDFLEFTGLQRVIHSGEPAAINGRQSLISALLKYGSLRLEQAEAARLAVAIQSQARWADAKSELSAAWRARFTDAFLGGNAHVAEVYHFAKTLLPVAPSSAEGSLPMEQLFSLRTIRSIAAGERLDTSTTLPEWVSGS